MSSTTQERMERAEKELARSREKGDEARIEKAEDKLNVLKRKLKQEEEEIKPHPSLQFGPISQTVAIMSALSLVLSSVSLPPEMIPFYYLFSRLTVLAVTCLVVHSSIIWYGYNEALGKIPKKPDEAQLALRKMQKSKPDRPDAWAHTRSHPSNFLSTKHAPPRIFPFPLGKSRPDASVKDELWWEGGNAPHVGHFNKPKIPEPEGPSPDVLWARVKANMEIDKQQNLWKKRIRTIQYLCVVIIVFFINSKVAVAGLCWLIYNTISNELDDMLKPPPDMSSYDRMIDLLTRGAGRNQSAPRDRTGLTGGMSYIYDQTEAKGLKHGANIPINVVPPHVLMTTDNHWYAGPGEQIKDPNKLRLSEFRGYAFDDAFHVLHGCCWLLQRFLVVASSVLDDSGQDHCSVIMSLARHSVAVYDDASLNDNFFEREKARLIEEISSGFEELVTHANVLNRKHEEVYGVGKEFKTVAALWGQFNSLIRNQQTQLAESADVGVPGTGSANFGAASVNQPSEN